MKLPFVLMKMAEGEQKKEEMPVFDSKEKLCDPKFNKYKDLLLDGECIKEAYEVGFLCFRLYVLLFTEKRLILIKKIPKNIIELHYKDIELVEFYTNIEWLKLFYAMMIYVLFYQLFININALLGMIIESVPALEPLLYAGDFFGMHIGSFLPLAALFIAGTYFAGLFVLSAIGRLRILIYDQPPFDIATLYDESVTRLIHTFAELSEKYSKERERLQTPATQLSPKQQPEAAAPSSEQDKEKAK